jgi:hypothetical protein
MSIPEGAISIPTGTWQAAVVHSLVGFELPYMESNRAGPSAARESKRPPRLQPRRKRKLAIRVRLRLDPLQVLRRERYPVALTKPRAVFAVPIHQRGSMGG